jgi:hypothetical protein
MGEQRSEYRICWEYLKGEDRWEDLNLDGRILLKFIIEK